MLGLRLRLGAFNDGCTAISWKTRGKSVLGQNWDWNAEFVPTFSHLHGSLQTFANIKIGLKDKPKISSA